MENIENVPVTGFSNMGYVLGVMALKVDVEPGSFSEVQAFTPTPSTSSNNSVMRKKNPSFVTELQLLREQQKTFTTLEFLSASKNKSKTSNLGRVHNQRNGDNIDSLQIP